MAVTAVSNKLLYLLLTADPALTANLEVALVMSNSTVIADVPDANNEAGISTLDECDSTGYARQALYLKSSRNNTSDRADCKPYDSGLTNPVTEIVWTELAADASRDVIGFVVITGSSHAFPGIPLIAVDFEDDATPNGDDFKITFDASGDLLRITHSGHVVNNKWLYLLLTSNFSLTANLQVALVMSNTTAFSQIADADDLTGITTLDEFNGANYARKAFYIKAEENDSANRADLKSFNAALDAAVNRVTWSALGAGTRAAAGYVVTTSGSHAVPNLPLFAKQFASNVAANGDDFKLNVDATGVAKLQKV